MAGTAIRVKVYSSQPYDKEYLNRANREGICEFHFTEASLDSDTVVLSKGYDAVCCFVNDDLSGDILEALSSYGVRLVLLRCTGFNNVDLGASERLGLVVMRVAKYSPYAVAEFAVALMLTLNRKIHRAYNRVREENFLLQGLLGFDMHDKTVGIVGTGKIGAITGKILAMGFGCRILAFDIHENPFVKEYGGIYTSMEELLKASDIISLHVPLTPSTYHMINEKTLSLMKKGALLINTSRGAIVDTRALIDALRQRHIGGAGLDVYEEEGDIFYKDLSDQIIDDETFLILLTLPNVVVTGHQAFFTREALTQIAETTIQNARDFIAGRTNENVLLAKEVVREDTKKDR